MKVVKRTVFASLAIGVLLLLLMSREEPKKSRPFSLNAICSDPVYHPEWQTRRLNKEEELETMASLSQPYRYLGSGGQCYAFVSEDERYVIKFFKQKSFEIPEWIKQLPFPVLTGWFKEKKERKQQEKRNKVFLSFKLSLDHLPKETGMLYVHLNPTSDLKKALSFTDAKGFMHSLDLDPLQFIVQKKAELAVARMDSLMQNKDIEGAKSAIDKLLEMNLSLYQKGFCNRDPNFRSNCGFIGPNPIVIDVGRMTYSQEIKGPQAFQHILIKFSSRFRKYLVQSHPELLAYFDHQIAKLFQSDNRESHEPTI